MTERSLSPLPPSHSEETRRPVTLQAAPSSSLDAVKILHDVLLVTEGRDKIVKLLQYTSRLIVLFPSAPSKRLRPFISQMSLTRKVIKLGHGIFPYIELRKGPLRTLVLVRAVVEFLNDFWDDVYCLSRIGFLKSPKIQRWSETWANRAWMMGIIMDLHAIMQRRKVMKVKLATPTEKKLLDVGGSIHDEDRLKEQKRLAVEAYWIDVSIVKLLADLAFCCFILFNSFTNSSN